MIKVLHSADWHIGTFIGPERDGVNLRLEDTRRCIEHLIHTAYDERADVVLISGDVFHQARVWGERALNETMIAIQYIEELTAAGIHVVVMRGTPNHDGAEQFEMMRQYFESIDLVDIVTEPKQILLKTKSGNINIVAVPGFDRGVYRAHHPGLSKEEENTVFTQLLSNIVIGMTAMCTPDDPKILMSHYTVPGCNMESGQVALFGQSEPLLLQETLNTANYDLVALGHIHRPQKVVGVERTYYSGAINAMNFNDEGQERGFWIHEVEPELPCDNIKSTFFETPYRQFITFHFTDTDITAINLGSIEEVASNYWRWNGSLDDKIVRILYECSREKQKAFNKALLEKQLYEDGAWYVSDINIANVSETVDKNVLDEKTDPEVNLVEYLKEQGLSEEQVSDIVLLGRPIIQRVLASNSMAAHSGIFVPVSISVKNYRKYTEESFDFSYISFCTINGSNGAGKSSLFMDAILDCLYEEPREGDLTGWISNSAKSGAIEFVFHIGKGTFRVVRTRTQSGKATLAIAELVDDEWQDRSKEKIKDTQEEIINIIGMDSLTFRSCALIMQDQYDIFLQASKEDRMAILGNILGLGIYNDMEKEARNYLQDLNRNVAAQKQTIKVQEENITAFGDILSDLSNEELKQSEVKGNILELKKQSEEPRAQLLIAKDSENRRVKLDREIFELFEKKQVLNDEILQLQNTQGNLLDQLGEEPVINQKVSLHNDLAEEKQKLLEDFALYQSNLDVLNRLKITISDLEGQLVAANTELEQKLMEKAQHEETVDLKAIEDAIKSYDEYAIQLEKLRQLQPQYEALSVELQKCEMEAARFEEQYKSELKNRNSHLTDLGKRAELLNNSECIDYEKANCKFLRDALIAKVELEHYPQKLAAWSEDELAKSEKLKYQLAEIRGKRYLTGFSHEKVSAITEKMKEVEWGPAALAKSQESKTQIALISARISHLRENIADIEKRLSEAKLQSEEITLKQHSHESAFIQNIEIEKEMTCLKIYIEKQSNLPVLKERLSNTEKRIAELQQNISELEEQIRTKAVEQAKEATICNQITELQEKVNRYDQDIFTAEEQLGYIQKRIGALQMKQAEVERIEREISSIRKAMVDMAKLATNYEILKIAFSQNGVPHNIVRSILPQLTDTANNILGQMTGGKMGIDFITEKTLKSNSKKEVITLDIVIEEYGKGTLPYLSKSGGEKVKAALSAVLALSEIKATSIGIKLGMLFIDEPPFLDADGVNAYVDALETIQHRYQGVKIMAITHDPAMKARFPQSIEVIKTDAGSKVIPA